MDYLTHLRSALPPLTLEDMSVSMLTGTALVAGVAGVALIKGTVNALDMRRGRAEADRKRAAKRARCARSLEDLRSRLRTNPISREEVDRITELSLMDLIKQLKEGHITPPQALRAYQTKALAAHERTNCLIEAVTEAERWAEEVMAGPRDGLLYGVPISLKDDLALKGYDSAVGCVSFIDRPAKNDNAIVTVLKRHGAIPFVRTNVAQLCRSFEPGNPIVGTVRNPHNLEHGPGGSSSGEGALSASGGSLLGFGSDLGGSVRVPAHFSGVCGFRPTTQRMSNIEYLYKYSCYQQNEIDSVYGPLAPEVDNIVLAFRALWDGGSPSMADLDPMALPLTFNEKVYTSNRKLRIGFYMEDGVFPVFPGSARAVSEAKALLEKAGHELVPWRTPDMGRAGEILVQLVVPDAGELEHQVLKYDVVHPTIHPLIRPKPRLLWLRRIVAALIRPLVPGMADQIELVEGDLNLASYLHVVSQLREYTVEVKAEWMAAGLDAVICPPFAMPAPPLGNSELLIASGAYSETYNALNMPGGIVPFTKVMSQDIVNLKDYPDDNPLYITAKKAMLQTKGMPIGVMVVGPRYGDEVCLRLMKEIESGLKKQRSGD